VSEIILFFTSLYSGEKKNLIKRNTAGLKNHAAQKRDRAFEKLAKGIKKLLREKKRINFKAVAEASGLSRAWLYKEPEAKARITQLRKQTEENIKIPPEQRPSEASKDAIIKTLKLRLKEVVNENKDLKKQLGTFDCNSDRQEQGNKIIPQTIKLQIEQFRQQDIDDLSILSSDPEFFELQDFITDKIEDKKAILEELRQIPGLIIYTEAHDLFRRIEYSIRLYSQLNDLLQCQRNKLAISRNN